MEQQILQQVVMFPWNPSTKGKKKSQKKNWRNSLTAADIYVDCHY